MPISISNKLRRIFLLTDCCHCTLPHPPIVCLSIHPTIVTTFVLSCCQGFANVLKSELLKQCNTELICRGTLAVPVYFRNHELLLARASCITQLLARCNEFVPPDSSPLARRMKRRVMLYRPHLLLIPELCEGNV